MAPPTTSLSIGEPDFRLQAPSLVRSPTAPHPSSSHQTAFAPSFVHTQSYSGSGSTTPSSRLHPSLSQSNLAGGVSPGSAGSSRPLTPNTHPKGHLTVKLMQARNLNIPDSVKETSRPYIVLTFENNEFVSREPIESFDEPATKGVATTNPSAPPTPLGGILGMGSISRAFDMAARSRSAASKVKLQMPGGDRGGATTPKATDEKKEWLSAKPSCRDPLWKHEVTL